MVPLIAASIMISVSFHVAQAPATLEVRVWLNAREGVYCVEGVSDSQSWLSCREIDVRYRSQYPHHRYRMLPSGEYMIRGYIAGGMVTPWTHVILTGEINKP